MTTVTGTVTTAAGMHPRGASVVVTLVDQAGRATPGFAGTTEVLGVVSVPVAADGSWSVSLTPSADITSARGPTLYQVTERVQTGVSASYYISVPATGPAWAGALRVTLPGSAPEQLVGYLPLTGGALSGPLILADASPAASEAYVASHGGGGGGGTPSGTVTSETSYGQAAAAGAATAYSRGDHTHGTPALPTPGAIGAATAGHTHAGVYDPAGTAAAAVSAHTGASDPHPQYLTPAEGNAAYAAQGHAHAGEDITTGTVAAARLPVGTGAGTVAAGNDSRLIGAVQQSLLTAKGDVFAATGSGVVARLPAGADGQVLTADAAQTSGLKWATPSGGGSSGGGPVYPLSAYGLKACTGDPENFQFGSTASNNTIFGARFEIPAGVPVAAIYAAVRAGGTYASSATPNQMGLYDDNGQPLGVTPDDSSLWTVAGWRGAALVGGTIAAQGASRMAYLLLLFGGMSGVVMPYLAAANDANAAWFSGGVGVTKRRAFYVGATSLPASFNPATYGTPTTYLSLAGTA
ncbi:hypothetical protein [Streptosporangium sp. NPDC006007]|uniref:hypothetical protein n=1 Tax=Streptosporangium sp. NPDC006007 TaxID=3154575 RepID=UPI0033B917DF